MTKVENMDFYAILDISIDANEKEVVTAYRKKALKCHPDKNPDNPKAGMLRHAAFDKALRAKKAAELRNRELDSKRRKLKEGKNVYKSPISHGEEAKWFTLKQWDLESREKAAKEQNDDIARFSRTFQQEIERLRREGSRLVEEEQKKLAEELKKEQELQQARQDTEDAPRLRVKWKAKKGDPTNGGYSQELLHKAFSKYGEITAVIVSSKKCGSAIVEFESPHSAMMAFEAETGLLSNRLTLSWLSGQPEDISSGSSSFEHRFISEDNSRKRSGEEASLGEPDISSNHDFESLVLHRMRQAEERRRLAKQMEEEDPS
ncbi:hypothetical protein LSH36_721g03076 [Paralvinella palmiformis]|uniref:Uncharacterized protein n=1 Tax=Paralvinella palmiformis TaxID=53620 RepID=A0AAD9J2F9_9ANNE|nr:hypothetical protein LSH36_721g03076 [Paralvinella palmiformis]